jgi:hypothetical protein
MRRRWRPAQTGERERRVPNFRRAGTPGLNELNSVDSSRPVRSRPRLGRRRPAARGQSRAWAADQRRARRSPKPGLARGRPGSTMCICKRGSAALAPRPRRGARELDPRRSECRHCDRAVNVLAETKAIVPWPGQGLPCRAWSTSSSFLSSWPTERTASRRLAARFDFADGGGELGTGAIAGL